MAQPKMARFSESLETTAQILGKDFGIKVITQGNRFRYDPAENTIYLPDIREEVDLGDESVEWERNAFLGGELHEISHKLFSDPIFLNSLVARLQKNYENIPITNRLITLLTMYNAMEDIRTERKLCEKYDGASDLLKVLQKWCENDEEGIVTRHIKKLEGFLTNNEKLTSHDIRLFSWFVSAELYSRIRYGSNMKELAYRGYQNKYECVRIINKLVDRLMKNEKLIEKLDNLDDIKAPLSVALAFNKEFHKELGKYFAKKEERKEQGGGNVPTLVSAHMPKPKDEDSEQEPGDDGNEDEGRSGKNGKNENKEKDENEKNEEGNDNENEEGNDNENEEGNDNENDNEGSDGEKKDKSNEWHGSGNKNKYDTNDENEDKYGDAIDDIVKDVMKERDSGKEEKKSEPLSDDKYNDKIYSMYINITEASAEQLDARNMLMNAKIFIKYFGKNMKSKIPFPPVLQHDTNIEVSSERMMRLLENSYRAISAESKEKFYADLKDLDKVIFDLKWKVYTKLLSKKKTLPRIDRTEGEIDNEALATYKIDPRIYYDLRWRKRFDTSVSMLCDLSGSMHTAMQSKDPTINYSKYKLDVMCDVMFVMSQIMQAFGIPFEVIGFNSGADLSSPDDVPKTFVLTDEMLMLLAKEGLYGDLKKYYRFGTVNNFILKSFRDNYETLRQYIYYFNKISRISGGACNCDNESFVFAVKRLIATPQRRKIMLIISDGMPNPAIAGNLSDHSINLKAAELQEKMGKANSRKAVSKSYGKRFGGRRNSRFIPRNYSRRRYERSIESIIIEGRDFILHDYIDSMKKASKYVEIGFISLGAEEIYNKLNIENIPNLKAVPIIYSDEIAPGILELLEDLLLKNEI